MASPAPAAKVSAAAETLADYELPQTVVGRIVKNVLPSYMQIGKETRAAFTKAASIYILYLTTTANDICKSKKRSTVTANDVLEAISEIQFEEMLPQLNEFLAGARQKADDVKSQKKRKADDTGAADDSKAARVDDAADAQDDEQAVDEEPVEQEDAEPEAEEPEEPQESS